MGFSFHRFFTRFSFGCAAVWLVLFCTPSAAAEATYTTYNTPRFTLHIDRSGPEPTSIAPSREQLAKDSIAILNRTYDELRRIFKAAPKQQVVLRFLSPQEFKKQTGAPSWTSAMYYRDEITIPLSESTGVDMLELERALRHEYVHAFIAQLSRYRCPAWLDEGIAQLIEGEPNPLLGPALRRWVVFNDPIPLNWLRNGFTTLDSKIVPAAYAQSLFATRRIVNTLGMQSVVEYLQLLADGRDEDAAFKKAFAKTKPEFERELGFQMRRWAQSSVEHP